MVELFIVSSFTRTSLKLSTIFSNFSDVYGVDIKFTIISTIHLQEVLPIFNLSKYIKIIYQTKNIITKQNIYYLNVRLQLF